jgi:hypothetical protein
MILPPNDIIKKKRRIIPSIRKSIIINRCGSVEKGTYRGKIVIERLVGEGLP